MNLALMRQIDEQFLETPFFGVRQMTWHLKNEGHRVNEKRIRRLMRLMGFDADLPEAQHLKTGEGAQDLAISAAGLRVERPNQVWAADITYLPMRRGFLYLVAIIDWFTRKVLAWRISNTLEADFCVEALNEAVHKFGQPEIMNTDQGIAVHVLRVDGPAAADGRSHLDGRQGAVPRQHLRRAAVAHAQIRVRLPARLGDRITGPRRHSKMDGVLQ